MINKFKIFSILLLLIIPLMSYSQINANYYDHIRKMPLDSITSTKSDNQKLNGIFISPFVGMDWPVRNFNTTSASALIYGGKIEFASYKLYPLVLGVIYSYQTNPGKDEFLTSLLLNTFDTKITSFGLTFDFLLNKYIKSNFTIPFLTLELKYLDIQRFASPLNNISNIDNNDKVLGVTLGGGFTLSIFDIYGTYTYAKDFSSAGLKTRIHFPVFKF